MNIANTCSKHVYAKVSNCFTLVWVSTFALTNNTIFFTAYRTNFSFKRHSFFSGNFYKFLCLFNIFSDWIVWTVKHNWRKTSFNTFIAAFISAMVKMKCHRNSDILFFNHGLYHICNNFKTCHVLSSTLRNA